MASTGPAPDEHGSPGALPPDMASVTTTWHGAALVVTVTGELDLGTTPKLDTALDEAFGRRPTGLIVDLSQVGFLASIGISALVAAHQWAADAGVGFALVATGHTTLRSLQLTGVTDRITVYPSRAQALDALIGD